MFELPRGEWEESEYPCIDGEGVARTNGKPVALPVETLLAVANACPKKSSLRILECLRVVDASKENYSEAASTDLESVTRREALKGEFPDIDVIIKHAESQKPRARLFLSIALLEKALKALKLAGAESVILEPTGEEKPIRVVACEGMLGDQVARAILMPLRSTKDKEVAF